MDQRGGVVAGAGSGLGGGLVPLGLSGTGLSTGGIGVAVPCSGVVVAGLLVPVVPDVPGVVPDESGVGLVPAPLVPLVLVPLVSGEVPAGWVPAVSLRLQPPSRAASKAAPSKALDAFDMDFMVTPRSRQSCCRYAAALRPADSGACPVQ
jgi:hypothetical protein